MYDVCTYDMMWCDIICYDTPYIYIYIHSCCLLNYICTHINAWLVVSNMFVHNIWDVMLPIDFHIFQDGYCTTNQMHMESYEYVLHLNLMTRQWPWWNGLPSLCTGEIDQSFYWTTTTNIVKWFFMEF